jgi:septum formation protein
MADLPLILASSSPRRRELLASLGVAFAICKPEVDETPHAGEDPLAYVQRLSAAKAAAAAGMLRPPALILAADTVVIHAGEILGKPLDAADARRILRRLRGTTHTVCTAVTLYRLDTTPQQTTRLTCTEVLMRRYSDAEIDAYIATGDPFDKAGSYAIQHPDFAPVARLDGSYTNVVGLPLETVQAALAEMGWPLAQQG